MEKLVTQKKTRSTNLVSSVNLSYTGGRDFDILIKITLLILKHLDNLEYLKK